MYACTFTSILTYELNEDISEWSSYVWTFIRYITGEPNLHEYPATKAFAVMQILLLAVSTRAQWVRNKFLIVFDRWYESFRSINLLSMSGPFNELKRILGNIVVAVKEVCGLHNWTLHVNISTRKPFHPTCIRFRSVFQATAKLVVLTFTATILAFGHSGSLKSGILLFWYQYKV